MNGYGQLVVAARRVAWPGAKRNPEIPVIALVREPAGEESGQVAA
jgi:hypothetical protein